jgi:glucokinase
MTHPPVLLGIDFGGTKIATAVCDLAGNKLASAVVDSHGEQGAHASFSHGVATATGLVAAHAAGATVAAVGVSTFGIPFEDRVELAPAIDGWEELELGRELRAAFPGAVIRMGTDTKTAAQAEARWGALAGYDPAIYLNLGTGLAAAIVTGGRVVSGSQGAAGEIGYSLREPADVGRGGGLRIPLEDMVSGSALQRRASLQGHRLTAAEVFAAAASDADLNDLVSDFVDELAFHVVNLAIAVNPARIAVGGGMTRSWERIAPRLEEALRSGVPYPPDLVLAHFPHDAPLLGAVALAVDAAALKPTGTAVNGNNQINLSKGHYSKQITYDAHQRPQGDLPAGAPQATSYPADL